MTVTQITVDIDFEGAIISRIILNFFNDFCTISPIFTLMSMNMMVSYIIFKNITNKLHKD
jgi:hypothetical protein